MFISLHQMQGIILYFEFNNSIGSIHITSKTKSDFENPSKTRRKVIEKRRQKLDENSSKNDNIKLERCWSHDYLCRYLFQHGGCKSMIFNNNVAFQVFFTISIFPLKVRISPNKVFLLNDDHLGLVIMSLPIS